ncbi:hypothetical protein A3A67_02395 [Candidatus Peribacteria bacterium RIFCSPLOWO2_01_FULL_51_18]|nr:MAG: hypothetical protein A3C52_04795 [Candidatus Peribacteria bacterium RIFCSPHIGHO2_02_FULL_51_15]OGJ66863.1 MAG: hypothetical protein A3A67_02395 [Candidatus Peribacteria bacterium RIFCSPLOWO2_01_FULL_51_18]OGJ69665.1 MAG: hypothetical protein A3J34_02795 [Candidatus Peribacteria bacterium RIFCSPLOWO2_02_FULL_51_10]
MNREDGMRIARRFKRLLLKRGYPVQRVVLFGSVARDSARTESDIDIAVVTLPFLKSQMQENVKVFLLSKDIDLRIETVTLHPEDFDQPFFTLGAEIRRTGIDV